MPDTGYEITGKNVFGFEVIVDKDSSGQVYYAISIPWIGDIWSYNKAALLQYINNIYGELISVTSKDIPKEKPIKTDLWPE